jgi:hygromycin-B 7''-O-kinase
MIREVDLRDPVLDDSLVLRLARQHLPSAQAVTAVDESGGEARAYFIDETYVFKAQRPHRIRPRTSLEKETFHLKELAARTPHVSVPRVLGYGRATDLEYILMTRMPGVAMRRTDMGGTARADVLRALGGTLRMMHDLDTRPFRASGLFPGDKDVAAMRQRLEANLQEAVNGASAAGTTWPLPFSPAEIADRVRPGLQHIDVDPVPLHSNPGEEHVFVNPDTLRFSGLIDFGDAYLSHPALDFRRWADPADRHALLDGYSSSKPLPDTFSANWRAISVAALLMDYVSRASRREASLQGLELLYADE